MDADEFRRVRVAVIRDMVRRGWRPPSPASLSPGQADWLLHDMERLGRDGRRGRSESLGLTPNEQQVLGLVACGLTAREIAVRLGRSPHTVKDQEKRIHAKLGARTNAHAVALAFVENAA